MPRLKNPDHEDCTVPLVRAHVQHLRELAVERSRDRRRVFYGDLVRQAVEEMLVRLGKVEPRGGIVEDDQRQLTLRAPIVAPRIGWNRRV